MGQIVSARGSRNPFPATNWHNCVRRTLPQAVKELTMIQAAWKHSNSAQPCLLTPGVFTPNVQSREIATEARYLRSFKPAH